MAFDFRAKDSQLQEFRISAEEEPDTCPCCHNGIDPIFKFAFFHDNEYPTARNNHVQAVFQCPRLACHRIFIAEYFQLNEGPRGMTGRDYQLRELSPYWYQKKVFPDCVEKLSPDFCQIFNDAAAAESWKLANIVGPGYRKALEFLIKDFLVTEYPEEAEDIKKAWLQNLIKGKITDGNIRACAERATWLGNDETHYLRKWEDKDISDLKTLILLSTNWIESSVLTKEYIQNMTPKKS